MAQQDPTWTQPPPEPKRRWQSNPRIEVDLVRYYGATLVAALICALVGVAIVRLAGDVFNTPLRVPESNGSDVLVFLSDGRTFWTIFVITIVAAGVLNLMLYVVPMAMAFWVGLSLALVGLSMIYPASLDISGDEKLWLVILHLVVGLLIMTLVSYIAELTSRTKRTPPSSY